MEDMLDLLESKMKKLSLNEEQKEILKLGLKTESFGGVAKQVAN